MLRVPERLAGDDVIDADAGEEDAQVFGTLLHTRLLGGLVAKEDECFGATLCGRVANILHRLPLTGLSSDEHFDGLAEGENLFLKSRSSGEEHDVRDGQSWIADDAESADIETLLEKERKLAQCGGRNGDEVLADGAAGVRVSLPAEGLVDAFENVIDVAGMDLVMETEDYHVVLLDEGEFFLVDRIVGEIGSSVLMVVKSWLVGDDDVVAAAGGLAKDVHGVEHGRGDAGNGCGGIASLESVHRISRRRGGVVLLDASEGLASGKSGLCGRGEWE
jgi:hypothetical protein